MIREEGVAKRLPGPAAKLKMDPKEAANPVTRVVTGERIIFTWSKSRNRHRLNRRGY